MRTRSLLALLIMLSPAAGCGLNPAAQLEGKWIGAPDTAAARADREAAKYRELVAETDQSDPTAVAEGDPDGPRRPRFVTDWEQYDVQVALEFLDSQSVRLEVLGEASGAPVEGEWSVIESGPAGMVIEIITTPAKSPAEDAPSSQLVRRRFEVGLDQRDEGLVGFSFNEVGADRRLGSLYFRRAE